MVEKLIWVISTDLGRMIIAGVLLILGALIIRFRNQKNIWDLGQWLFFFGLVIMIFQIAFLIVGGIIGSSGGYE